MSGSLGHDRSLTCAILIAIEGIFPDLLGNHPLYRSFLALFFFLEKISFPLRISGKGWNLSCRRASDPHTNTSHRPVNPRLFFIDDDHITQQQQKKRLYPNKWMNAKIYNLEGNQIMLSRFYVQDSMNELYSLRSSFTVI